MRYGHELNSKIRSKALEVLEVLREAFPFIPYEEIKSSITSPDDSVIKVKETERIFLFYPYSSWCPYKPVYALINLCEKLEKPEVLLELQKPLILALAYISSRKEKEFSETDFPELKPIVLDRAINLALKRGWIVRKTEGSYEIREKPKFYIKCPHCQRLIEAHEEYCPHCGLYLLNIILRDQKSTSEDIKLYSWDKKGKWVAVFYLREPTKIEVDGEYYYFPQHSLSLALDDAKRFKIVVAIPDYLYYAKCYTDEFTTFFVSIGRVPPRMFYTYYKVEGEDIEEIHKKLTMILDIIEAKIEEVYEEEKKKDFNEPFFRKYKGGKDDFVRDVLEICKKCFTPRLDEHPILRLAEEDFKGKRVGPRGQTIEEVKPAGEVEIVEPSRVEVLSFPQELLAKYEPLELLGEGGFARVFKVKRRADGRVVALKVLNEKRVSDVLAKEVAAWLSLDHKNIAKLYGVSKDPVPHLEIELVEGVKIGGKKLVRDLGGLPKPIDVKLAIKLVRGIAEGLRYAHSKGVFHRDLKPQNILLSNDFEPKITDWGLAKVKVASGSPSDLPAFTPLYAAPEQLDPKYYGSTDQRTDIFQLGLVFYELLTGRLPFEVESPYQVMSSILSPQPFEPVSKHVAGLSRLDGILAKMLAKRKEERYQSIEELIKALDSLEEHVFDVEELKRTL